MNLPSGSVLLSQAAPLSPATYRHASESKHEHPGTSTFNNLLCQSQRACGCNVGRMLISAWPPRHPLCCTLSHRPGQSAASPRRSAQWLYDNPQTVCRLSTGYRSPTYNPQYISTLHWRGWEWERESVVRQEGGVNGTCIEIYIYHLLAVSLYLTIKIHCLNYKTYSFHFLNNISWDDK